MLTTKPHSSQNEAAMIQSRTGSFFAIRTCELMNYANTRELGSKLLLVGGLIFALIGLVVFLLKVKTGLMLFEYGDESEKFVAAQMIAHGQRLYSDIFAHHGPFPYIIAHMYTWLVSSNDFTLIRLSMAFLALGSCGAIVLSPILNSMVSRTWAAGTYLSLLSIIWILQGIHMILYEQIGGFLLIVPLFQVFAPLFLGVKPTRRGLLLSGMAITFACFTTYAFGPPSILMLGAALICIPRRSLIREVRTLGLPLVLGMLTSLMAILAWMLLYGDLKGFLVYHFYFNQEVYLDFVSYSPMKVLDLFAFSLTPKSSIHTFSLILMGLWSYFFSIVASDQNPVLPWALRIISLALIVLSVLLMNPRGDAGFHDSGFVIVNVALFAVACGLALQHRIASGVPHGRTGTLLVIFSSIFFLTQVSNEAISSHGFLKKDLRVHVVPMKRTDGGPYDLVRSLTGKDGKILVLIFNPGQYIKVDRLPASGNYYYLPWQASYDKHPITGFKIDICHDIAKNAPAAIWFDDWKVWGRYSIEEYEPCVPATISANYVRLNGDARWFVRKDLASQNAQRRGLR
jgi:hypothetical protein